MSNLTNIAAPVRPEAYEFIANIGNIFFMIIMLGTFIIVPWVGEASGWQIATGSAGLELPLASIAWLVLIALLTAGASMIDKMFIPAFKERSRRLSMVMVVIGAGLTLLLTLLWTTQAGASLGVGAIMLTASFLLLFWQMRTFRPVLVLSMALVFCLFPVIWIISASFNPSGSLANQTLIPQGITSVGDLFVNYRDLLSAESLELYPFWTWMRNSLFVASVTTVFAVMISALAAYAFSRFRFAGRKNLLILVLLIQVFPNMLAMVALFLILQQIGKLSEYIPAAIPALAFIDWSFFRLFGLNSLGGLILVYLGTAMGINTWLMKGFYDSVPRDIDESAQVDGASHWQTFWQLIFPLVRPILAVVAVIAFVGTFNEFILANVLLRDKNSWTVMVGLYLFVSDNFAQNWGKFAAGAVITAVPVVVLYLLLQDQIVGGLTQGAVKG